MESRRASGRDAASPTSGRDAASPTSGHEPRTRPEAVGTVPAGPEHAAGLVALFEVAGSPCFCRYWHFTGDTHAWLDRCANAAARNRDELGDALARGAEEARGVVALRQGGAHDVEIIGWLKVTPARLMAKAYDRRLYRKLPCFDGDRSGVFLIGCALVHPAARRRGVAAALVAGAVRLAPHWGARALEALPRRPSERVSDEELWTGPMGAFRESGFVEVSTFQPYPVLRRDL